MKLISLDLKNFRQHLDSSITFSDGVTGIIGPNGAGKSTVLECLAWALYGAPAVRGTNDTIRSKASEGGAKVSVSLVFELSGSTYKVTRGLDGSGRSGHAVLEVDGKPLRQGMSEVSEAVAKLLGMDYRAFFTSFFTGQKQLEFMSQLDGRQRAVAISRMLGYDRLTKARDQANEDRKGLAREIEGLERGLPDPEELKARKKESGARLTAASDGLKQAESEHGSAKEALDKLKPVKDASDQKAKRHEEISRRLEVDRSELARAEAQLAELRSELADLEAKGKQLDALKPDLERYDQAGREFKAMKELQEHEGARQLLTGQISASEQEIKRIDTRLKQLPAAQESQTRAGVALSEAEAVLVRTDQSIQELREGTLARQHSLDAQIAQLRSQRDEVESKRARIAEAGADGKCPTCERPLSDELPTVLGNFDSQSADLSQRLEALEKERVETEASASKIVAAQANRVQLAAQVEELRAEKAKADGAVVELESAARDRETRASELDGLQAKLALLPTGFDQARYKDLQKTGEELKPVREKSIALKSALDREPVVRKAIDELLPVAERENQEIVRAETALSELAFVLAEHEKLSGEYESAASLVNALAIQVERDRGEVGTATAILAAIGREEDSYKSRMEELQKKRSERAYLQTLAEAFDKLRGELNDRIRPELESIASELLATMTDGRYNVLRVNDSYQAVIVDDGEEKPVISGGEDDIVNLALRLAISQMIADRAGQSFSLLILDEVFGSLDDVRRDNVVALLQNLKNRFEQIILITHVESIHDAVDNCLWVEFDERTKTSRLTDRSPEIEQSVAGLIS